MQQEQRDRIERVVDRLTREYGDKESKLIARHNARIQKLEENADQNQRKQKEMQESYQEEVDTLRKELLKSKAHHQEKESDIATLREDQARRQREKDQLRELIRNHKDNALDKQQQHDQKVKAMRMESDMQRQKLQGQLDVTTEKLEGQLRQKEGELKISRKNHETQLNELARKWKSILTKKDDDIRKLREELAGTDIRLQQFQRHFSME